MMCYLMSVLNPEGHVLKSSLVHLLFHVLVCYPNFRIGKLLFMFVVTSENPLCTQFHSFSFASRVQLTNLI